MGILQARILEWVVLPSSRGSSQPRDRTQVSYTAGAFFTDGAAREALLCNTGMENQLESVAALLLNNHFHKSDVMSPTNFIKFTNEKV